MSLYIVIGYTGGNKRTGKPKPIYVGRDAEEARAKCEGKAGATVDFFEHFSNPIGLLKANPKSPALKAQAKADKEAAAAAKEAVAAVAEEKRLARIAELKAELKALGADGDDDTETDDDADSDDDAGSDDDGEPLVDH